MQPSYIEKLTPDELSGRAKKLVEILGSCRICPHKCEVNRVNGETGICRSANEVIISSISPHFGEEAPLVGMNGSGTIFFTNCNLSCEFCQNYSISHLGDGRIISIEALSECMLHLQKLGCHNINLVTPTHYVPQIVCALEIASGKGLELPVVYNCGGYESVETLKLLKDIVDIYMPDIKYSDNETAEKYSGISNYWDVVKKSLKEMHNQVGDLHIKRSGIATRGLLIRHLVLPNKLAGSIKILDFIANELSVDSYVNIMDQYRPAYLAHNYEELNRPISSDEFYEVISYAKRIGFHRGFY
ncbi:radical SAM protein [Bacteroidota bacterium]